jgi:predicted nucleic acid-binding protein
LSSGFLLDTSIVSLFAPGRPALQPRLATWFERHPHALYLSAITIAEVEQRISRLRRLGAVARAARYSEWLDTWLEALDDRVVAFDARVGRIAGALSDKGFAVGRHPGFADVAIAATAAAHDFAVVTANARHFSPLGVEVHDLANLESPAWD